MNVNIPIESSIWDNLKALQRYPNLHDLRYKLIHEIFATKDRLFQKNIIKDNVCKICNKQDTLSHRMQDCIYGNVIWKCCQRIM